MTQFIYRAMLLACLAVIGLSVGIPSLTQAEPIRSLTGRAETDPAQATPARDDVEWLAMASAGPDREALRLTFKWHNAFFAGDRETIKSIAGDPIFLDQEGVNLDQYMDDVIPKLCCVTEPEDRPFQIADIVIQPAWDPVTGEPLFSRGIEGLNLGPNDRIVILILGVPNQDNLLQPMEGIVHYIRYVPEGIYQIAGTWD